MLLNLIGPKTATGETVSLLTNLVGYWEMSEPSGDADDDHSNGLTLSNVNTVSSAASGSPQSTRCRSFAAANNECFTRNDEAAFELTGNFSMCVWINLDTKTDTRYIGGQYGYGTPANRSYFVKYDDVDDRFELDITDTATTFNTLGADTFGSPSTGTWYFIYIGLRNGIAEISVNNGTKDTNNFGFSTVYNSTVPFAIGSVYANGALEESTNDMDGDMWCCGLWSKSLNNSELAYLYNSGSGRLYSELV